MNWIPDLSAAFPAPRDDEPPELRRRIIAELRDHLECAYQRELVLTGDADEAVRRVRQKFGDPVQLARKLWFEALKDKIMSQRLMLVCVGILTAACMAMGIFSWKTAEQSALATQALVERLDLLVQASAKQRSLDWVDVKVKLVAEGGDAPPPEGIRVQLNASTNGVTSIDVTKTSSASGELDFGLLSPGRYNLTINTPWGEGIQKALYVRAGESPWVETVICPPGPLEVVKVQFEVDWPDDLKRQSVGLLVAVTSPYRQIGGEQWYRNPVNLNQLRPEAGVTLYLVDAEGNVRPYTWEDQFPSRGTIITPMSDGSHVATVPRSDPLSDRIAVLHGLKQSTTIWGAILLSRQESSKVEGRRPQLSAPYIPLSPGDDDPPVSLEPNDLKITVGTVNRCRLTLPERLIEDVRQKLQERPPTDSAKSWKYEHGRLNFFE